MSTPPNESDQKSLLRDTRAVVFTEYVALLSLVTLGGALAVYAVGSPLLHTFRFAQLIVAMPIP